MKWVYGLLGGLILLVLVIAIVGWLLPVKHETALARFVFGYTATMESFLRAAQRALVDR